MVYILTPKELVLVKVLYYMPDNRLILNEFNWQTEDLWPSIPRVHQFLIYWKNYIEAPINIVEVASCRSPSWRAVATLEDL